MALNHVVLSGCSGGGKSSLLAELQRRGYAVALEPGRRIVEQELLGDGAALPWVDLAGFARKALRLAADDRLSFDAISDWVFFDRGLIDAAAALQYATGQSAKDTLTGHERYHNMVFMTPPWPEIYETDTERPHDLSEAIEEYERLLVAYEELGYETLILPKASVPDRADYVLLHLS